MLLGELIDLYLLDKISEAKVITMTYILVVGVFVLLV